jgi:hypothetical protein
MKVEWIEHHGKPILYVKYSGAKNDDELIAVLHQEVEIERKMTDKILCLVTVADTHATQRYMDELKRLGKEVRNEKVLKTATLGVTGVKKLLFTAYVTFTGEVNKLFNDEKEAKDWLVG